MPAESKPARDVSIDYLRATLTLMVLAHHSMLAYPTFAHFDKKNLLSSTAPVVDHSRWIGFDYLENLNDVFFMSAMFFISGLFVLKGISKAGGASYLKGRILRLLLPFVGAVILLMPL